MNAIQRSKSMMIEDRVYTFTKFTAMEGLKLGKLVVSKLVPLLGDVLPGVTPASKNVKGLVKGLDSSVLDTISMDAVAKVFEGISPEDLETIAQAALTRVSTQLEAILCPVVDKQGFYQIEEVEYDPVLFIRLIWEQLKFGLSDFFIGDRWASLFPAAELDSDPQNAAT